MGFNEVIGQKEVISRLRQMAQEDRIPHAIMLCGPKGCGKMAVALAFASYLLCRHHNEDDEPCGHCPQCAMLRKWEHPDLHFTFPTVKPSNKSSQYKPISDDFSKEWHQMLADGPYFTLEQWMDKIKADNQQAIITTAEGDSLIRKLSIKSSQGGYKVSVIWLPERMNKECSNKLLKLIEEPPFKTVFIMVCEKPDELLDTIKSRVQRIDVRRIGNEELEEALTQRCGIDGESAHRLARLANGSWTTAVNELSTDNENKEFLSLFQELMRQAYKRDVRSLKKWSENINDFGREKQKRFLSYFIRLIRENFMYNFHIGDIVYMTDDEERFAQRFARFINENNILQIQELADKAIRDIKQNTNGKIVFFDMALQMIVLLLQK